MISACLTGAGPRPLGYGCLHNVYRRRPYLCLCLYSASTSVQFPVCECGTAVASSSRAGAATLVVATMVGFVHAIVALDWLALQDPHRQQIYPQVAR
jgi:hypothetical protein